MGLKSILCNKPFNPDVVLELIKLLVDTEAAWIPNAPGYSLYIRPTIIGTRACKHSVCSFWSCVISSDFVSCKHLASEPLIAQCCLYSCLPMAPTIPATLKGFRYSLSGRLSARGLEGQASTNSDLTMRLHSSRSVWRQNRGIPKFCGCLVRRVKSPRRVQ